MDSKCIEILNKWAEYVDYDPNQTKFVIKDFIGEYEINKITKKIAHINEEYDESGILSIIIIKNFFLKMMQSKSFNLIDLLRKPEDFQKHIDMYNVFCSDMVNEAERNYANNLYRLASEITGLKMLEMKDTETGSSLVLELTEKVIDSLDKLHVECYKKGGEIGKITKVSTVIHIFPSLGECVLTLDNAPDGLYLCYIDVSQTADSYFGFFIKSNGNIFSLNERINEAYKGSHQHSRNGRWAENKADDLFPYDFIFNYGDYDYKGYSTKYMIDDEKLSVFNLQQEVYMPILLAMVFIVRKYTNATLPQEPVYIDSLLQVNIQSITENSHELSVINQNPIVQYHKNIDLSFDLDTVLNGSALEKVKDYVVADNYNQLMVDLYGDGFEIKPTLLSTQLLLEDGKHEYVPEFVGSEQKMQAQAYYEIRKQLANYIRENMMKEYLSFGGFDAVKKWFEENVRENITSFERIIKEKYVAVQKGDEKFTWSGGWSSADPNILYDITMIENDCYPSGEYRAYIYNNVRDRYRQDFYYDIRTSAKCSIWFVFKPKTYLALEQLFGKEVPKIIKGWRKDGHHTYGNSILDMTDPVEDIGTPFESYEYEKYPNRPITEFKFAIGYSKRGLTKMMKEV